MKLEIKDGLEPSIGGVGENLRFFLVPLSAAEMVDRVGKEKSLLMEVMDISGRNFVLTVAKGTTFRTRSGSVTSFRYLLSEGLGSEFVGCIQVTKMSGSKDVLGNIYVLPNFRRMGLATALLERVKKDRPKMVLDSSLTELGAKFFGYGRKSVDHQP